MRRLTKNKTEYSSTESFIFKNNEETNLCGLVYQYQGDDDDDGDTRRKTKGWQNMQVFVHTYYFMSIISPANFSTRVGAQSLHCMDQLQLLLMHLLKGMCLFKLTAALQEHRAVFERARSRYIGLLLCKGTVHLICAEGMRVSIRHDTDEETFAEMRWIRGQRAEAMLRLLSYSKPHWLHPPKAHLHS